VPKGADCPDFYFSKPVKFPTVVTYKSPTVWSHIIDHRRAERVAYHNCIQDFWSFGQSETQKFSSIQLLFCPETEFSSKVDAQNSVTSKSFVGWGWISNRWKAERVSQLFGIQLKGRIQSEQPQNWFSFDTAIFREYSFRNSVVIPKL
jgi:hypothetical protein